MHLDQTLVDAAIELLNRRFPGAGGIAAAVYLEDGTILTSVMFQPEWGVGGLCAETGAILEANKLERKITAVACVSRLSGSDPVVILTPCGVCQERLFHWGEQVEVAVPDPANASTWMMRTLKEIQPYYWVNVYKPR